MQPTGYSPFQAPEPPSKWSFRLSKLGAFWPKKKKWLKWIGGLILLVFLIFYLALGELRVFANNYLRLGFFHKDYLILLQNDYELRPGGGFITGYGELSMTLGLPTHLSFKNSYEIDTPKYVIPPYPHEELLKNEWYQGYTFRDANWSPHFPDNAATLIDFYQQKFPDKEVDGIIVVNFSFIEKLVGQLGGIEIDGKLITQDNFFKSLTDSVNDVDRHNEEALANRKSVLSQLVGPLVSKLKFHPFLAISTLEEGLDSKAVYLWFKNEKLQQKMVQRGWANTMESPENSDFLAVNLANLGSKKADRYLEKEVYQQVNLKGENPEILTGVELRFPGERNIYADDYKGYLRLYLPKEAEILSPNKDLKIEEDGSFKVLGQIINLKAGETKAFEFKYKLPSNFLSQEEYHLRLLKQSGDHTFFHVSAENQVDHGFQSKEFEVRENKAFWQGELKNDLDLSLKRLEDNTAPYPITQVFDQKGVISIYWNEAISPDSGAETDNYEIIDLDKTDPKTTDQITIKKAEVIEGNVSKLLIEGATKQNEERYQITLKGIRDVSNNLISPDPKIITVVQRLK